VQRLIAGLAAAAALAVSASPASAAGPADPIGELVQNLEAVGSAALKAPELLMKATLYHSGVKGVGVRDSLGCRVQPMRTLAVDPKVLPRHSVVYIPATVGLPLPGGGVHDGIWYASDTGGAIKGKRIDLYAGASAAAMRALSKLNLKTLTVMRISSFDGCPPSS
jgi:3D (Asp-Asp-Asp) domain-containing protein